MASSPDARTAPHKHLRDDLTDDDRAELRRALEVERATLLARTTGADQDELLESTATRGQGETEHTVNEIERSVYAVLDANAREALEDIHAALARLDDGTYGMCAECGQPIPTERLRAIPAARLCVPCQERQAARR